MATGGMAAKLLPHLSTLFYAQMILLCAAVLVGAVLILRRQLKRQPLEGDPAYTREKIASELTTEIARLRDLRSRIMPELVVDDAVAAGPQVTTTAATAAPMSADEKAKLAAEVEAKFKADMDALKAELETAKTAAAAAGTAPAPSADGAAAPAGDWFKEKVSLEEERGTLKSKVEHLEKTLLEYQIFENDIALVKKYKAENEDLRKQLSATPQVTEEDIASLFSAMSGPGGAQGAAAAGAAAPAAIPAPIAAAPAPAPEMVAPAPVVAAPEPTPAPAPEPEPEVAASEPGPSIDDLLKEAGAAVPEEPSADVAAAATNVVEEKLQEPAVDGGLSPDDLEALAQTDKNSDDQLMAEFQKILGGEKS